MFHKMNNDSRYYRRRVWIPEFFVVIRYAENLPFEVIILLLAAWLVTNTDTASVATSSRGRYMTSS
jgi:hypothetical protein